MKKFLLVFSLASCILYLASNQVFAQTWNEDWSLIKNINTWPQKATITLKIDVPKEYLQTKNILEAATIYGVDAQVLAQKIWEHYTNKFKVQELDTLDFLQKEHWVIIDDIKSIALWLQSFYPAPPEQKETLIAIIKETKIITQREFVFWSVIVILLLYFISYFLTYRELIHHNIHKRSWNTLLLISVIWYWIIVLSYIVPKIYEINLLIWLDVIYQNLRIWFIIIFLGFSHALRYLFHYRPLKKKLHKISAHQNHSHHVAHDKEHKDHSKKSHSHHTTTKAKKI